MGVNKAILLVFLVFAVNAIVCVEAAFAHDWPEVFDPNLLLTLNIEMNPASIKIHLRIFSSCSLFFRLFGYRECRKTEVSSPILYKKALPEFKRKTKKMLRLFR